MKPSTHTAGQPPDGAQQTSHEQGAQTASAIDLERFLPYRLIRLSAAISRGIAAEYQQQFGLSIAEWRVLAVIARFPASSASELGEHTGMDKVSMHRAVRALQQQGLIASDQSTRDRRRQHLRLSRSGQQLHDQIAPRVLEFEQRLLAPLGSVRSGQLHALLEALQHSIEALDNSQHEAPRHEY